MQLFRQRVIRKHFIALINKMKLRLRKHFKKVRETTKERLVQTIRRSLIFGKTAFNDEQISRSKQVLLAFIRFKAFVHEVRCCLFRTRELIIFVQTEYRNHRLSMASRKAVLSEIVWKQ